jgi:PTS system cellobiose-specific IIB component
MNTILIVCGAGASSTFLAMRLRAIAATRGVAVVVEATSEAELVSRLADVSVVLVGPHLAPTFDAMNEQAKSYGVAAALLPPTAFQPGGAEAAFELASGLLHDGQPTIHPLTEGISHV